MNYKSMNHQLNCMKKYILKPGNHQFVPGSAAVHNNDNLTDQEADWYLNKYPHIAGLFAPLPPKGGAVEEAESEKPKVREKRVRKITTERITPPSGDREAAK
jgi:glyoxylate utilization-related uncharacterized protein